MGRHSDMIPMNGRVFRSIIQKRRSLASLEPVLGVKRQAVNAWITQNRVPPRSLIVLTKELGLTLEEIDQITGIEEPKSRILFRSNRNVEVAPDTQQLILEMADDYFRLNRLFKLDVESINITIVDEDPARVALTLLDYLGLRQGNLSFGQAVNALKRFNINVLFFDFGNDKAQAVCVEKESQRVVIINSHERVEDIVWRLFHELCHVFCGHNEPDKQNEKFCNAVATQVVTPAAFFARNHEALKNEFSGTVTSNQILLIEEIMSRFGAGFMGVVLQLHEMKITSKAVDGHLWKIWHQKRKHSCQRIMDIYSIPEGVDPVKHWTSILKEPNYRHFVEFQLLVLSAVSHEQISVARASELLDLDTKSIQELAAVLISDLEVSLDDSSNPDH